MPKVSRQADRDTERGDQSPYDYQVINSAGNDQQQQNKSESPWAWDSCTVRSFLLLLSFTSDSAGERKVL